LIGLEFRGRHGVREEEARLGARFLIDVELRYALLPGNDRLADTADYAKVHASVREEVTGTPVRLIETLALRIADRLLAEHPQLQAVLVRVHKPQAPLDGPFTDVYAETLRERPSAP
jgi:dihydroneopterin aldolase